ncbi:MAG: hypothetical protein R2728_00945 [Chitinophagales bacterium]
MPKEKKEIKKETPKSKDLEATYEALDNETVVPNLPTSLNEELSEKIKGNPNKFIGCGG